MSYTIHPIRLAMPFRMGFVNCYLIETSLGSILVDTGSSNKRLDLENELTRLGCQPGNLKLIVLTHGDFDHTGNAAYMSRAFGAKILMHAADAPMVQQGDMFLGRGKVNFLIRKLVPLMTGFGKNERFIPHILVEADYDFSDYGWEARIVLVPGHSRGSIAILTEAGDLFSGDLVENTKKPALNTMLHDLSEARASLEKLKGMTIQTVYPGHGKPFSMQILI